AARATCDEEITKVVVNQARILAWGVTDRESALQMIDRTKSQVESAKLRLRLDAARASVLVSFGLHQSALDMLAHLDLDSDEQASILGLCAKATALIAVGQVEKGLALGQETYGRRVSYDGPVGVPHPAHYLVPVIFGLAESGRLSEAYETAENAWDDASADEAPGPQAWLAVTLSRYAMLLGMPLTAKRWAEQGASLARRHSLMGTLRIALSRAVEAAAVRGDTKDAEEAIREGSPLPSWGIFRPELALGEVWLRVASGDLPSALAKLNTAIIAAHNQGNIASESRLLLEAVRLGDISYAGRLAEISDATDGWFMRVHADFAMAKTENDPERLLEICDSLESAGASLLAAEAAASAASAWRRLGRARSATSADIRMASLAKQCQGADTPALMSPELTSSLTKREMEIALLAAAGLSSIEIAEHARISRKTVDNHLQKVYVKLGISDRRSLRRAIEEGRGSGRN
ncbi:LuxR C-terminal-related transcriptional regulator, partial [Bacillus subtilis]